MTPPALHITIPGQPIAQPRHRSRIVWPAAASLRRVRSVETLRKLLRTQQYVPAKHPVHGFRDAVATVARLQWAGDPIPAGVPLRLDVRLYFPRPKAITRKTLPNPREWHTVKPDADNVLKAVKDAMSGVVYHNDQQIACESIAKWTAAGGEEPRTVITIRQLAISTKPEGMSRG